MNNVANGDRLVKILSSNRKLTDEEVKIVNEYVNGLQDEINQNINYFLNTFNSSKEMSDARFDDIRRFVSVGGDPKTITYLLKANTSVFYLDLAVTLKTLTEKVEELYKIVETF